MKDKEIKNNESLDIIIHLHRREGFRQYLQA